jgi:hypothetical protein
LARRTVSTGENASLVAPCEIFQATEDSAALELKLSTYEQIRIVFNRRHHRDGVSRFFLPTAGHEGDHDNCTSSGQTDADAIANASQDDHWRGTED